MGRLGVWTDQFDAQPVGAVLEAAARIEELGFGALWLSEVAGREAFTQAALVLGATRRMTVGTAVATIYGRDAVTMAQAERTLAEAFPERFVLGLGSSHPWLVERVRGHTFGPRVPTMRGYLDAMDAAPFGPAAPAKRAPRLIGAVGRRMLRLAAERTSGALPFGMPVAHTARAREIMGPDAFLAVQLAVVLEPDPAARAIARTYVGASLPNRAQALTELGHGADVAAGGTDRLAAELVVWGGIDVITRRVAEHRAAGADHICLYVLTAPNRGTLPLAEWATLAAALA